MKTCSKCRVELPLSEFGKRSRGDGYESRCRACNAARNRAYYVAHREEQAARSRAYHAAHPEKGLASSRAYYAANRERLTARDRAYRAAHPEKIAAAHLKNTYGMTAAEKTEALKLQGGLCACGCGLPATHIDHCRDCEDLDRRGSVRGILCLKCNAFLEHIARFSPVHAAYLARHAAVCPALAVALVA